MTAIPLPKKRSTKVVLEAVCANCLNGVPLNRNLQTIHALLSDATVLEAVSHRCRLGPDVAIGRVLLSGASSSVSILIVDTDLTDWSNYCVDAGHSARSHPAPSLARTNEHHAAYDRVVSLLQSCFKPADTKICLWLNARVVWNDFDLLLVGLFVNGIQSVELTSLEALVRSLKG